MIEQAKVADLIVAVACCAAVCIVLIAEWVTG